MSKRELIKTIREKLANGSSKDEIFKELSTTEKPELVSKFLAWFPIKAVREQYKVPNTILAVLLFLTAALKVYLGLGMLYLMDVPPAAFLILFFLPVVNLVFFFEIRRYNGSGYRVLTLLCVASLVQISSQIAQNGANFSSLNFINILNLSMIALVTFIGIFSWILGNKMFPYFKGFGIQKDQNGNYIYQ